MKEPIKTDLVFDLPKSRRVTTAIAPGYLDKQVKRQLDAAKRRLRTDNRERLADDLHFLARNRDPRYQREAYEAETTAADVALARARDERAKLNKELADTRRETQRSFSYVALPKED
jgi:hypothetical protein